MIAFVPPGAPERKTTHTVGRQAAVARSLSQTLQEGDNVKTLFFRASQLEAREQMAQLKDGWRPLAIALSSDARDADDGNDEEATEARTDKTSRGLQASLVTSQKT